MENFTNDQTDSLLWYETLRKITEFDIKQKNVEMPTIAIRLTASGLLYKSEEKSDDGLIFCVPYSNHVSFLYLLVEKTNCLILINLMSFIYSVAPLN